MNNESESQQDSTAVATDDVEQRLIDIAALMSVSTNGDVETATSKGLPDDMACPVDPAERALCEGCQ